MTPFWYWDKEAKQFKVFPYHLLQTLPTGEKGFYKDHSFYNYNPLLKCIEESDYGSIVRNCPRHFKLKEYDSFTEAWVFQPKKRNWVAYQLDTHRNGILISIALGAITYGSIMLIKIIALGTAKFVGVQ